MNFKNNKNKFNPKTIKSGAYATALSALVIALVVAVNLITSILPSQFMSIDLTDEQLFSLSEESKTLVSGLTQDISIYYLARTGQEDMAVQALLDKYKELSPHISVSLKDPTVYPGFGTAYDAATASAGSVIIDGNNGRYRVIDATELYTQEFDYTSYTSTYSFVAESKIASAIAYIITDDLPKAYFLTGHGEAEVSSTYSNALIDNNVSYETLNLLSAESVPEDADLVMLNACTKDLTSDELQKLTEYLQNGGNFIIVTNYGEYSAEEMPNIAALMKSYGLTAQEGVVMENDANYHLTNYTYYLLPNVISHNITEPLLESYVVMPLAHGITIDSELPENVMAAPLLQTTSTAYLKENAYSVDSIAQTETDLVGQFNLAAIAENTAENSKVIWMTSSGIMDDSMNSLVSGTNLDFFLNAVSYCANYEAGITVHAKSLSSEYLTVTQAQGDLWSTVFTMIIPIIMLIVGLAIWARRRKR